MDINEELEALEAERERLVLPFFNEDVAWRIGCHIREVAAKAGHPIGIEVSRFGGGRLFYASMPGATPDNASWIRRKRNVVERFYESSLYVTLKTEAAGTTVLKRFGLPEADFVHSGGGVAVRVPGTGCVGTVAVSGLKQRDDHRLAVAAISAVAEELQL